MKAVLFDLDGTLLPMDQEKFVKAYFGLLTKKLALPDLRRHFAAAELCAVRRGADDPVRGSGL